MRKAIEAFEKEFALWGLNLPARDVVDRQGGHLEKHGWTIDYSFGADAFGEYLEYHAQRAVPEEPVIERHARVYANGEKNFVPAPSGEPDLGSDPVFITPDPPAKRVTVEKETHHPTLPPFASMVEEAAVKHHRPTSQAHAREEAKRMPPPSARRESTRAPLRDYVPSARPASFSRQKSTIMSLAIGVLAASLVAIVVIVGVKSVRAGGKPDGTAVADSASLDPVLVLAPAVLGFTTEGNNTFSQPLVGAPADPNRAEVIRPERGMTPIIPSDPGPRKKPNRPAATTRGEKFHVP